jgi:hypothetical protein
MLGTMVKNGMWFSVLFVVCDVVAVVVDVFSKWHGLPSITLSFTRRTKKELFANHFDLAKRESGKSKWMNQ